MPKQHRRAAPVGSLVAYGKSPLRRRAMKIKQTNRLSLLAQHSFARGLLHVSAHAAMRSQTRSELSPDELLTAVLDGKAVLLPYKGRGCTYHLLYRPALDAFFVAVVSADRYTYADSKPKIITVLPLEAFEESGATASRRFKRLAAHYALGDARFREWDVATYGADRLPTTIRVITYVRDDAGEIKHHVFTRPPICRDYVNRYGLQDALGHPGMLDWFRRQIERAAIDVERVVSLRIADTVKVELRLDVEPNDCPDCVLSKCRTEENTPPEE